MNKEAWISAITAFLISAGGAIGVVLVGDTPTIWQVLAAIVLGLVTAAKDIRSLFKLPPVDKLGALLLCSLMSVALFTGCGLFQEKKLEAGGAYAATATTPAQPELFALDASFDLAYTGLDSVFKFERANRQVLWNISPEIKRTLDQLRGEAGQVVKDYAVARAAYVAQPHPFGLDQLQTAVWKITNANAAALAVVQTKGVKP